MDNTLPLQGQGWVLPCRSITNQPFIDLPAKAKTNCCGRPCFEANFYLLKRLGPQTAHLIPAIANNQMD